MRNPFNFLKQGKAKGVTDIYSLFKQNDIVSSNQKISSRVALQYNQNSLYINKGFLKRAEKVSEVDFILRDRNGKIIENSEKVLDLLNNPNPQMTGVKFWSLATQYHDITGMAVIKKISNSKTEVWREDIEVTGLELLNSAYIEINEDAVTGNIKSFTYSNPVTKEIETIPYEQCIYWHIPDPTNSNQPMPLLLSGLLSIQSNLESEKQYNSTLKNGGSIDGLFRFKEGLNAEQVETLKKDYARLLRDNKEANIPLILGGDATFERVALSPQELQSIENKKLLLDDLLAVTGVPKSLLGINSDDTYSNAETSYRIFLRETIKPLINSLVDVLDWKLIPQEYTLDFVDPTPENVEEKIKVLEVGSRINALTLNEKREMLGLDAVKDGDDIDKAPEYKPEDKPKDKPEKKNLKVAKQANHPLRDEDFRDVYYKGYVEDLNQNKKRFRKELNLYFAGQKQRVLATINTLKSVEGMKAKDFAFDILNESLEIAYMNPLLNTMRDIAKEEGEKTALLFNTNFVMGSATEEMVDKRFKFFADTINATTAKVLKETFSDWVDSNETIADLSKRISDTYDFDKTQKWKADRIVNTEVSSITNLSKREAYQQAGINTKIWVHRAGIKGGIRDSHSAMDGEEVPFGNRFSNGMLHPHDPTASAGEVINCMCTF